jgi:hypothetical protein
MPRTQHTRPDPCRHLRRARWAASPVAAVTGVSLLGVDGASHHVPVTAGVVVVLAVVLVLAAARRRGVAASGTGPRRPRDRVHRDWLRPVPGRFERLTGLAGPAARRARASQRAELAGIATTLRAAAADEHRTIGVGPVAGPGACDAVAHLLTTGGDVVDVAGDVDRSGVRCALVVFGSGVVLRLNGPSPLGPLGRGRVTGWCLHDAVWYRASVTLRFRRRDGQLVDVAADRVLDVSGDWPGRHHQGTSDRTRARNGSRHLRAGSLPAPDGPKQCDEPSPEDDR